MIWCFLTLKKLEFAHKITRANYENLECKDNLVSNFTPLLLEKKRMMDDIVALEAGNGKNEIE